MLSWAGDQSRSLVLGNGRQGNIVITGLAGNRDGGSLYIHGRFAGLGHEHSYGANWFKDT